MKTLRGTKVKICMLILVLLIQVASPLLTIMVENLFTLTTLGAETEETTWDISANGDGSITAVLDEEGTLTITGTGAMKDWSSSSGVPWSSISTSIKKVVIGEGVTTIGRYAFSGCSSLEEITIPSSVTSIGNYAFYGCSNLEEIKVTEGNKRYISEEGVLYNKDKTKLIRYPEGKSETKFEIPTTVTSIDNYAFYDCSSLKEITIPSSVTSIAKYAFSNCSSLEKITIPSSVTNISNDAFSGCSSLKEIEVNEKNKKYISEEGVLYNKNKTELICYPAGKSETKFEIPTTVTSIGDRAFEDCSSLEKITIPSSVTSISNWAFPNWSNLTICCKTDSTAHKYAIDNNRSVKLDDDAPSITKVEGNPTEWTKEDVVLTVTAEDEGAGLAEKAYSFDNGQTWQEENTKTYTENTSNIVIKVKDALDNIATYETINISKIFKVSIKGYKEVEIENKKYIKNIKINETIGNLKENITTNGAIKIYKGETEITDNNSILATGMKLAILIESEVVDEYIVVVIGDVNGDGEANLNDILSINKHRLNKMLLSGANLLAGDVDGNGKADLNDILKINKYRLGKIDSL